MEVNLIKLGWRVRYYRLKRGMSQMTLAELTDLSTSYISYIESGDRCVSLDMFITLAKALDVTADELLIDSLGSVDHSVAYEFSKLLRDCTEEEKLALLEIASVTKEAIRGIIDGEEYIGKQRLE